LTLDSLFFYHAIANGESETEILQNNLLSTEEKELMGSKKRKKRKRQTAKKTPKKTPKKAPKRIPETGNGRLIYSEYEITSEPLENKAFKRLPAHIRDRAEELHDMVYSKPKEVIPELSNFIKTYSNVPMFYNYLSAAYSRIGDTENAEAVALKNYKKNPDYLFARLNYAQICLRKGETEKIPEIFNNKFDLKQLYPRRSKFHVSEVAGFMGVTGMYFAIIGERETAKLCYRALKQIVPRNQITRQFKRILYPSPLIRVLRKLTGVDQKK